MSTNTVIGIIVALVVLLGGGYLFYSYSGMSMPEDSATETTSESAAMEDSMMSEGETFASVLAAGTNVQCAFTNKFNDTQSTSGHAYIAAGGEMVRADLKAPEDEGEESHMLRKDGFTYLWGSMAPQGIKFPITEEDKGNFASQPGTSAPDTARFTCTPWIVDETIFELPEDVEFMELTLPTTE